MIVADTNVLSEPLRPEPSARVLGWLSAHSSELAITSITVGELRYGALRLPPGRRRRRLLGAITALIDNAGDRILEFGRPEAEAYAEIRADRESRGLNVSVEDSMIAAICHVSGCYRDSQRTRLPRTRGHQPVRCVTARGTAPQCRRQSAHCNLSPARHARAVVR